MATGFSRLAQSAMTEPGILARAQHFETGNNVVLADVLWVAASSSQR